jgi:hypothetical protein
MNTRDRTSEIRGLLATALDCDEEYLYEGEMSYYARTYAGDAVSDLRMKFASSAPNAAEIDVCVAEISKPERIANGKSHKVLLGLSDKSRPLLDALSCSDEARLRHFALEAGGQWTNHLYYSPLYPSVEMKIRLLDDPDEDVRLAAVRSSSETMLYNMKSLGWRLERDDAHWFVGLYQTFFKLLDDASPKIRAAAAEALGKWAAENARDALIASLAREDDPEVREKLTAAITALSGDE